MATKEEQEVLDATIKSLSSSELYLNCLMEMIEEYFNASLESSKALRGLLKAGKIKNGSPEGIPYLKKIATFGMRACTLLENNEEVMSKFVKSYSSDQYAEFKKEVSAAIITLVANGTQDWRYVGIENLYN